MTAFKKAALPIGDNVPMSQIPQAFKELRRVIDDQTAILMAILNRGITFTDNMDARTVSFSSSGTPNAENTVAHTLGKIPTGFIIVSTDKAAHVYAGGTTWTTANIYLKSDVATVAIKIIVF